LLRTAKACICIYLEGGPSHIDLFDPKPKLQAMHGQALPESMTKNVRFAFLQKATARIMGSRRVFKTQGGCAMELSDLLPQLGTCADDITLIRSMHTDAFNHHPGQLIANTGSQAFGRPSMGSWLTYGLRFASKDLPGMWFSQRTRYVGRNVELVIGLFADHRSRVLFRNQGEPILNLTNPKGLSEKMQERTVAALRDLNGERHEATADPEIASRIAAYELAFRMQKSAPELIDLSKESKKTLNDYGVNRTDPSISTAPGRRQERLPLLRRELSVGPATGRAACGS
jgi:hypothetical protein